MTKSNIYKLLGPLLFFIILNLETNRKSPTNRLGFIEPEGIVKGSKAKLLKKTAIAMANTKVLKTSIIFSLDSK